MMQCPFYNRVVAWEDTKRIAPALKGDISKKYTLDPNYVLEKKCEETTIDVQNEDLIDLAKLFLKDRPLVVNPADDSFPGGCVHTGSGAAEESLFRRSNYFRSLSIQLYPLRKDEAVYSPSITVFKNGDFTMCEAFEIDFIACPGLRHPELTTDGKLTEEQIQVLECKIYLILQVAQKYNHSVVIMAAIGCGAWKCPPLDVAETFKRVLNRCNGCVQTVVFAIKQNTENGYMVRLDKSRPDNYTTFKSVLVSQP